MFVPVNHTFTAYRGASFSTRLTLYTDTANTLPFDLTDYTPTLAIGPLLTLTDGHGLTSGNAAGTIDIFLTSAQTRIYVKTRYKLSITNGIDTHYLMHGTFHFASA